MTGWLGPPACLSFLIAILGLCLASQSGSKWLVMSSCVVSRHHNLHLGLSTASAARRVSQGQGPGKPCIKGREKEEEMNRCSQPHMLCNVVLAYVRFHYVFLVPSLPQVSHSNQIHPMLIWSLFLFLGKWWLMWLWCYSLAQFDSKLVKADKRKKKRQKVSQQQGILSFLISAFFFFLKSALMPFGCWDFHSVIQWEKKRGFIVVLISTIKRGKKSSSNLLQFRKSHQNQTTLLIPLAHLAVICD